MEKSLRQMAFDSIKENISYCIDNDLPQIDIFIKEYLFKIFFDTIHCGVSIDEATMDFKRILEFFHKEYDKKIH